MVFSHYNLYIISDFDIRIVHEDQWDIDLLIPLNNRTLNFSSKIQTQDLFDIIQFPHVYGLLVRIAKSDDNNSATLHVLRNIDLNSTIASFELNYENLILSIENYSLYCRMNIINKEE